MSAGRMEKVKGHKSTIDEREVYYRDKYLFRLIVLIPLTFLLTSWAGEHWTHGLFYLLLILLTLRTTLQLIGFFRTNECRRYIIRGRKE